MFGTLLEHAAGASARAPTVDVGVLPIRLTQNPLDFAFLPLTDACRG